MNGDVDPDHARPNSRGSGLTVTVGFCALLCFVFLVYSRLSDFYLSGLYLPLLTSLLALAAVVLSGRLLAVLRSRPGVLLSCFSAWLLLAVPFSVWRGGSLEMLAGTWLKSFLVFVIVGGVLDDGRRIRKCMFAIAAAGVSVSVVSLVAGVAVEGVRRATSAGVSNNPNELALIVLMAVPFTWLSCSDRNARLATRAVALAGVCVEVVAVIASGSRSGLLAAAVMGVVVFWRASIPRKILLVVTALLAVWTILPLLPATLRDRYATLLQGDRAEQTDKDYLLAADASRQQRSSLLWQSIELTARHPLVGVGPGMFQVAAAEEADRAGEPAAWRETHNTYTQVSSEAGLPALALFLGCVWFCIAEARRIARLPPESHLAPMASALLLSIVGWACVAAFASLAYQVYLPTLAGLTLGLSRACSTAEGAGPERSACAG